MACLLLCTSVVAQTYYVSSSASGGGVGTEKDPLTLVEAFSKARAGHTYWVKAGNYGAAQLNLMVSGTQENPIIFEGYRDKPGDLQSTSSCSICTTTEPDTAIAPTLTGTTTDGSPDQDQGIRISGAFIHFKNFAFRYYNRPFESSGSNNQISNLYIFQPGNHNVAEVAQYLFSPAFPNGGYTGYGLRLQGDGIQVRNSRVVNAGAEGVRLTNSKKPRLQNIEVICTTGKGVYTNHASADGNITDYHFLLGHDTADGIFENITITNPEGAVYPGHGFAVKPLEGKGATNHLIDGFTVTNTLIETQFPDTQYIVFRNGEINSTDTDARREIHGARIANASQFITIENTVFNGARFMSWGWDEALFASEYQYAARDVALLNCLFNNTNDTPYSAFAIAFNFPRNTYLTENITIDHVTVYNYYYLWETSKPNKNIRLSNLVVDGIKQFNVKRGPGQQYPLDADFTNSNFSNGITPPQGSGITRKAPLFADPSNGDFTLGNSDLLKSSLPTPNFEGDLDIGFLKNREQ
ncbi:hypothetical protein SAMN04490243_2520 [Robiginitalea myxolifaciens]|uniref:Right handed beta helix region n=2 Tax=Robiginitalea myxolifaciens TaxID=400055 RepID=A0A1I6HBH8_9FLAO|nr:hypothetical protein SAMN04490243_2520 [Robiginitalea myxolifaciens]